MSPRLHRLLCAIPLAGAVAGFAVVVQLFVFAAVPTGAAVVSSQPQEQVSYSRTEVLFREDSRFLPPTVAKKAATLALRMVGKDYRWGGESPAGGFDCSGLIRWAYSQVGVDLPHNSHALYGIGREVSQAELETGDVLFFSGLGHVGLYLGGGLMVHAPYSGKDVEITALDGSSYGRRLVGARRVASA
jgi:cell wall-associated NlpC family hydrolase